MASDRARASRRREIDGIAILAGSEVNILPDGKPDYADAVLGSSTGSIASVHTAFRMDEPR